MGYLLLQGGAEFSGLMSESDMAAIKVAGGAEAPIAILPTAAAPDHNHERAGRNGLRWFTSLGARRVDIVPVIDPASADDRGLAERLRTARIIYLLGGFPNHLGETLRGSRAWQAALEAFEHGAVIAGSSAGAMVLCEDYYDPYQDKFFPGLNLLPGCRFVPHHNTSGRAWAIKLLASAQPNTVIGVDEQTGILSNAAGEWTVYGRGKATIYRGKQQVQAYGHGENFKLFLD